jgi:asparagine synthase (glutamine-hydrolysing)
MTSNQEDLVLGSPRFHDAAPGGPAEQWRQSLARHGAKQAAALTHGDFAVALRANDGSVFMAVDRMAIRSLCYRVDGGTLSFAERADVLAGAGADLDPQALFDYLYFHIIPSPRTVFQGVHRLPPGHYAVFNGGQLTVAPYWVPTFTAPTGASLPALRDEFKTLLRQAVARQLDGSRAACFLSGGTDSSTVAGMIGDVTGHPAATYSIGFAAEGYDEMEFARLVARHFGCEHHEHYVTPDDLLRDIPRVAASYDQPFGNSSALPSYHCAAHAKSHGVTRLLGGDGGDELFGGNTRYATQRLFGYYQQVPQFVRKGLLEPFFGLDAVTHTPLIKKGSGYIRQANTPLPDRAQAFNLLRRLGYGEVLTPAFLSLVDQASVDAQQREVWAQAQATHEIDRYLAYDWRYTLAECDLPKVCGTTALAGLSVGFPMLDDDLLAFSMRLPPEYKLKGMQLRWFFKDALRDFLPSEVIRKKKQGFGLPFGIWLVKHDGLRRMADDAVNGIADRGLIKPGFVRELMHTHLPAHPHYYGTMVWILSMLEHWLQRHAPRFRVQV